MEELKTAELDWYREFLYEHIPIEEIVEYIFDLQNSGKYTR